MMQYMPHSSGEPIQTCAQLFQLLKQIQSQCSTGQIDAQITLEPQRNVDTMQTDSAKTPAAGLAADRFDDAFLDQFVHPFRRQSAGVAQIGQRQLNILFQHIPGQQ